MKTVEGWAKEIAEDVKADAMWSVIVNIKRIQAVALKSAKDAALKSRNGSAAAEAIQKLIDDLSA